jgi:hypothetical protein
MNQILKIGGWIGAACVAWTFVMGFTGWYKDPALLNLFFLVILIEIALLFVGLRATAVQHGYGQQVLTGTLMSVVAAAIIFCGSLVFTNLAFPSYFADLRAAHEQMLRAEGKTQAEIDAAVQAASAGQTPLANAMAGAIGTVVTGGLASAVIAIFQRRK